MQRSTITRFFAIAATVSVLACGAKNNGEPPLLDPPAKGEGYQLSTPKWTLQPGEERTMCLYTTMPGSGKFYANRFELKMRPGSHHFLIYRAVNDLIPDAPEFVEGFRECDMDTALPFNGSQVEYQDEVLPPGVASELTGGMNVILETHYVNYTSEPLDAQAWFNLYFADPETVEHKAGIYITYNSGFSVPVGAGVGGTPDHVESMTCGVPDATSVFADGIQIFTLSSHMHWHGRQLDIWTHDMQSDTDIENVYTNTDWSDPARVRFPDDQPLTVTPDKGFRYACSYFNDTGQVVNEGQSADDEMCMMVAGYYPAVSGPLGLDGIALCFDGDLYY